MAPDKLRLGRWARWRGPETERGFTMVEVVVAFTLLIVIIIPAIALVESSTKLSGDIRSRVVAANLESQQIEITTAMQFSDIQKPGPGELTWDRQVGSATYTVHQSTRWVTPAGSSAPCGVAAPGTPLPLVLLVHVSVTWPSMGSTPPPSTDTTITPPAGAYSTNTGTIAATVKNALSQPVANVPVTVTLLTSPFSTTGPYLTDASGCVLFAYLAPLSYRLTAQQLGYVGQQEETIATSTPPSVTLVAGANVGVQITYAPSAVLPLLYTTPGPPADMPITVNNPLLTAPHSYKPAAGTNLSSLSLWAYPNGYTIWPGACSDSIPLNPSPANVTAPIAPYTIKLQELDVRVVTGSPPTLVPNATVKALEVDPTCASPASYTLAPTPAALPPTPTTTTDPSTTSTDVTTTTALPTTTTTIPAAGQGVSQTGMPLGTFRITASAAGLGTSDTQTAIMLAGGPPVALTITLSP